MSKEEPQQSKKRLRKRFVILLLLLVTLLSSEVLVGALVKNILLKAIGEGTGSSFTFSQPIVTFFPPHVSSFDAVLKRPGETDEQGVFVNRVSFNVSFWKLFTKEIAIGDLHLIGASSTSARADSALLELIRLFTKPSSRPKSESRWHDFITRGWSLSLDRLFISGKNDKQDSLIIEQGDVRLTWTNPSFELKLSYPESGIETEFTTSSKEFSFKHLDTPRLDLGSFVANGSFEKGKVVIEKSSIGLIIKEGPEEEHNFVNFSGDIPTNLNNEFAIKINASAHKKYLGKLLRLAHLELDQLEPHFRSKSKLTGTLLKPSLGGNFTLSLEKPPALFERESCGLKKYSSDFNLTFAEVSFSDFSIEDIAYDSSAKIKLSKPYEFDANLKLKFPEDSPLISACYTDTARDSNDRWFARTLKKVISNSNSSANLKGRLSPLSFTGKAHSDTNQADLKFRSKLDLKFALKNEELNVIFRERGTAPQILQEKTIQEVTDLTTPLSTPFVTVSNSNIDGSLKYNFSNGDLNIQNVNFLRYPIPRLIVRFSPFFSEELYSMGEEIFTPESLIDGSFQLSVKPERGYIGGKSDLSLQDINLFEEKLLSAHLPLNIDSKGIELNKAEFLLPAGEITANGKYLYDGKVDVSLETNRLLLHEVKHLKSAFPNLEVQSQSMVKVSGTTKKPMFEGDAQFEVLNSTLQGASAVSTADFKTTDSILEANLRLLGNSAKAQLVIPLEQTSADISVKAELEKFPLDQFLHTDFRQSNIEQISQITGTIDYKGPKDSPLEGSGTFHINDFDLFIQGAHFENSKELNARVNNDVLKISNFELLANGQPLLVTGLVGADVGWDLKLESSWKISSLKRPVAGLEQLAGNIDTKLSITGPLNEPEISGPIKIENGTASFPLGQTFIGADHIFLDAYFKEQDLIIKELEAVIGTGKLRGQGSFENIFSDNDSTSDLEFDIKDIIITPRDKLSIRFDGQLALVKEADEETTVSGNVEIHEAIYEDTLNLNQLLKKLTDFVLGSRNLKTQSSKKRASSINLDIHATADDNILIDTNVAQAELKGDITLIGSADTPRAKGTVDVIHGTFGISSRQFEILNGSLIYTDSINSLDPRISMVAASNIETADKDFHRIQITISDTLTNPRVDFTSSSGLDRNQIVALLNIGGSFEQFTLFDASNDGTTYTYQELLDPRNNLSFAERLRNLSGFDKFELDSKHEEDTGDVTAVVSAQRSVSESIGLNVSSELGGKESNVAELEYRISPRFSYFVRWKDRLETQPDATTGSIGVGLKFRETFPGITFIPPLRATGGITEE